MVQVAPISLQQSFWNRWNASNRENSVDEVSRREAEVVYRWLGSLNRKDLDIADVGCGTGWFCPYLTPFGRVTATDLSDEVLARAQHRAPDVRFVSGDFMNLDFGTNAFDVVVTLEVLAHVADQRAFLKKLACHLRPSGHLMLATQNRWVLRYLNLIPPPAPGQLRRWVDQRELRELLEPDFEVLELFSVTLKVGGGLEIRRRLSSRGFGWPRSPGAGEGNGARPITAVRTRPWLVQRLERLGLGRTLMAWARKRMQT